MGVVLDKGTYEKYKACREPELKALINIHVSPNHVNSSDINFGMIRPSRGSACPFLTRTRLCGIQEKLGESYLSRTCSVYPRAMSTVDGVLERSLYLSCPEAARLVLLNPDPIPFETLTTDPDPDPRLRGFPVLDTASAPHANKPYHAFHDVRAFILSLLQNRTYRLWERLIILGMFCEELNKIGNEGGKERTDEVIGSFSEYIRDGLFGATLDAVTIQPTAQLRFLLNAIEYRVHSEPTGERFLECYHDFLSGIGFTEEADIGELSGRYAEAFAHYNAFMETHESFAKAIEHNPPYLKRVTQSLAENRMTDLAVLAVLIKSPARENTVTTPKLPAGSRVVLKAPAHGKKAVAEKAVAEAVTPRSRPAFRRVRKPRVVPAR
jgi:lysine-N-methylase